VALRLNSEGPGNAARGAASESPSQRRAVTRELRDVRYQLSVIAHHTTTALRLRVSTRPVTGGLVALVRLLAMALRAQGRARKKPTGSKRAGSNKVTILTLNRFFCQVWKGQNV
jgi:hypothetical protein